MKTRLPVALLSFTVLGGVQAQTFEISVLGGLSRMGRAPLGSIAEQNPKEDDTKLKSGFGYGVRVTLNTPGYYGHELGYIYNRATLRARIQAEGAKEAIWKEDKIAVRQAFYNFLMYFMPKGERFRPFMTGGLQMHQYGAPGFTEWSAGSTRNYGANYGGGIKIKLFNRALIRLDIRDYIGGKPYDLKLEDEKPSGGLYRQQEASFGVAITF